MHTKTFLNMWNFARWQELGRCWCYRYMGSHMTCAPQVNGGTVEEKVDFAHKMFEKSVRVDSVFQENEMIDTIAITRGRGTEGVVTRWGVSRLPRKTHRGLRKASAPCQGSR